MSDNSANLSLPYLFASQSQKHVTLNESLNIIDNLVMLSVKSQSLSTPPANPNDGDRYIIGANPTGVWQAKPGQIAAYLNLGWQFHTPKIGFSAFVIDEGLFKYFDGTNWLNTPIAEERLQNLGKIGVGTIADNSNPISAKVNNALFSAKYISESGNGDIRVKLNKEASAKTASFIFQSNWQGKAEFGLLGDDNFGIKVSSDGNNWKSAICFNSQTGVIAKTLELSENPNFGAVANLSMVALRLAAKDGDQARLLLETYGNAAANYCGRAIAGSAASPSATGAGQRLVQFSGFGYGASGPITASAGLIAIETSENWTDNSRGTRIVFGTTANGTSANQSRLYIENDGSVLPAIDNSIALGSTNNRFSTIYCATGTINTSDVRDKIEQSEISGQTALGLLSAVNPKIFKWKVGRKTSDLSNYVIDQNLDTQTPPTIEIAGTRNHAGFFAQDVKAALDDLGLDLAVWGYENKDDPNSKQWLRPDQMLPILWAAVKELKTSIDELKQE